MGNQQAHAQEAERPNWGHYGPGVKVMDRKGGEGGKSVTKDSRYVEVSFKGRLAGGEIACGSGHLDLNLVNQAFGQLSKGDQGKGSSGMDDIVEDNGTNHRNMISANGPTMGKIREGVVYGRAFAPLGTALLKCMERTIGGGYGDPDQPAPMAVGETVKFACTKDIFKLYNNGGSGDLLSAPARGLYSKRFSTAGVAKFEVKLLDAMEKPPWTQNSSIFKPGSEEWARRGMNPELVAGNDEIMSHRAYSAEKGGIASGDSCGGGV
jgi:hypothetical protein